MVRPTERRELVGRLGEARADEWVGLSGSSGVSLRDASSVADQ